MCACVQGSIFLVSRVLFLVLDYHIVMNHIVVKKSKKKCASWNFAVLFPCDLNTLSNRTCMPITSRALSISPGLENMIFSMDKLSLSCCIYLNQSQYPGSNAEMAPEIKLVQQYDTLFSLPANVTANAWLQLTIYFQPNY